MKLVAFVLTLLASAAVSVAQTSSAADLYRIAARNVPSRDDAAEEFVWLDVRSAPLNDASARLIQRGRRALELFDNASKIAFGDWGFDSGEPLDQGRTLLRGDELADLIVLRARSRASQQDYSGAFADVFNLAQLARRLSAQPSLPRQQQQNVIFEKAMQLAASLLLIAPAGERKQFVDRLSELRSPADPVESAKVAQRGYLALYSGLIDSPQWRQMNSDLGKTLSGAYGVPGEAINVDDLARDQELCDAVLAQTRQALDEMITALNYSPIERDTAMVIIPTKYRPAHPLVRGACALVQTIHRLDRGQNATAEMFKAAAEICSHQPIDDEAARKQAGSFRYAAVPGGFDLKAAVFGEPQLLVLHVGSRPVRVQPATQRSSSGR